MVDSISPLPLQNSQPAYPNNNIQGNLLNGSATRPHSGLGIVLLILSILLAYFALPILPLILNFIPLGEFGYVVYALLCLSISAGLTYGLYFMGVSRVFMAAHLVVALPLSATFGYILILRNLSTQLSMLSSGDVGVGAQAGSASSLLSLFGPPLNLVAVLVILIVCLHAFSIYFLIVGKEKPSYSLLVAFVGIALLTIVYFFSTSILQHVNA